MKFTLTNQHIDDFDLDYKRDRVEVTVNGDHIGYFQLDEIEVVVDSVDIDISGEDLCDELEKEDALELFRLLQEKFEFDAVDSVEPDDEPEWEPGLDKCPGRNLPVPEGHGGHGLARALAEFAPGDVVLDAVLRFTQRYAGDEPMWARRLAFVALRAADVGDSAKHLSMMGRATVRRMIKQRGIV